MIILFLSIIAAIAFIGMVGEFENQNKNFAHHLACVCCAAIVAIAIIMINK